MQREITSTPYSPHSYVNELADTAWSNFFVWQDKVQQGDVDAQALAYSLDVPVFQRDAGGARTTERRHPAALFEDLATGIYRAVDHEARLKAIVAIFGSDAQRDAWFVIKDCVEERDMPPEFHDLQGRILFRIESGHFNGADVSWVHATAAGQVTDKDMLSLDTFSSDQPRELFRRVVRARQEHRCHWTGLPIAASERHLVICEVVEGDFLVSRYSRLACWFGVYAEDINLAEMLKPGEADPAATAFIQAIATEPPAPTFNAVALREAYRLGYDRGTYDAGGDPVAVDHERDGFRLYELADLRQHLGDAGVVEAFDWHHASQAGRSSATA